jgi:hypothetical protein
VAHRTRARSLLVAASGLAAAAAFVACRDDAPEHPPEGPAADLATIADDELVDRVLDACHRPLRGQMQRLTATITVPGQEPLHVFAELPSRLRTQRDGRGWLLSDGRLHDLAQPEREPTAAERDRLLAVLTIVDAAALGPLHRATGCRRTGERTWSLAQPDGSACRVTLRPGVLLPEILDGPGGSLRFVEHLATATTWIARVIDHPALGRTTVHFEQTVAQWADDFFAPPAERADRSGRQRIVAPGIAVEPKSAVPIVVEGRALRWVVLDDPGDWPARARRYAPVHDELERQQQQIAGFPVLFTDDDGSPRLAAPFRRREGGPALEAPADWRLRDVPDGRWLAVHPRDGDVDARAATGRRQLEHALAQRRVQAASPIVVQPWIHLHEGAPDEQKLATAEVRVAVRLP